MSWLYLVLAGLFEIGWPVGLKIAQESTTRWSGILIAVVFMVLSGFLLWLAQRQIPIGTAYAVWTGIGAAGTFLVGIFFYGDPASMTIGARHFVESSLHRSKTQRTPSPRSTISMGTLLPILPAAAIVALWRSKVTSRPKMI